MVIFIFLTYFLLQLREHYLLKTHTIWEGRVQEGRVQDGRVHRQFEGQVFGHFVFQMLTMTSDSEDERTLRQSSTSQNGASSDFITTPPMGRGKKFNPFWTSNNYENVYWQFPMCQLFTKYYQFTIIKISSRFCNNFKKSFLGITIYMHRNWSRCSRFKHYIVLFEVNFIFHLWK